MASTEPLLKQWFDKFLVINFFIIIGGFLLFLVGVLASTNGLKAPYVVFQSLWLPLFIPSISLFFTAVLGEALWKKINKES